MNIAALERDFETKKSAAASALERAMKAAQAHEERDDAGTVIKTGRPFTDDEKKGVQALIDEARAIQVAIDRAKGDSALASQIDALGLTRPASTGRGVATPRQTLGEQFIASEAWEYLKRTRGSRGTSWITPSVELTPPPLHSTLLSETGPPALSFPDYRPGIVTMQTPRPVVADLIASGTTDGSVVVYMREDTFTNAADSVAEGAAKPESALGLSQASDPVRKIAHWLPVTEEMLEDAAQIRSYIDARLRLGVMLAEEDQLLNGTTTPPDIVGIRNRTGLTPAYPVSVGPPVESNMDAIFKQAMAIFNASMLMPDGVVLNPLNWQTIQLAKDTAGRYYGAGPFAAPPAGNLWGMTTVTTPKMPAGVGLVGAFMQAAQVFRKGGIRVEASNSHADYFVKNIVAIRAEERLALAVYRPSAFGEVTGLA